MKATYVPWHSGSDLSVVNAARVSFGKKATWAQNPVWTINPENGEPQFVLAGIVSEADQSLIKFLARGCTQGDWNDLLYDAHHARFEEEHMEEILNYVKKMPSHWSPFAHTSITIHLKMPIFVARQIMKHTTGLEYNEVSRRYVDEPPEFYVPDVWRFRSDNVKQGSQVEGLSEGIVGGDMHNEACVCFYSDLLDSNVAPEVARMVLPQSMYTEVVATGNLYAWANLYNQRTDSHAQKETQELAHQIGDILRPKFPTSWEALTA